MMLAAAALLLQVAGPQISMDEPPARGELRFGQGISRREGDEVIFVVPDIRLRTQDIRLTGDYGVLWFDANRYEELFEKRRDDSLHRSEILPPSRGLVPPKSLQEIWGRPDSTEPSREISLPPGLLREAYVEGTVFFAQSEERVIQAERLYLDLRTGRAVIQEGRLRTTQAGFHGKPLPLSVKAKLFRREATGRFVAEDAEYTTCSFGRPHQHIRSKQIWLEETEYGTSIDAYDSTFLLGDTGIFHLPRAVLDPKTRDLIPFRGAKIGTTSTYGLFVYTEWGQGFSELGEDFNELVLGERMPFRGSWGLRLDHRRKRGEAIGPELEWETPGVYKGRFHSYYLEDEDSDSLFYPGQLIRSNEERGSAAIENRVWFGRGREWTFDTELSYLSDPGFLPEFFRKEWFQNKEPETSAYLRWARDNQAFTALVKTPINEFDPVPVTGFGSAGAPVEAPAMKESLPELRHRLFQEPLFTLPFPAGTGEYAGLPLSVLYTENSSIGYLRRRPADGLEFAPATITFLPADIEASARLDSRHELRAPFHAEPFVITPYVAERYTVYSQDLAGDETARLANEAGLRVATHLEGRAGESYKHLIDPSIAYENIYAVTRDPSELIAFDETESLVRNDRVLFSLRNRIVHAPRKRETDEKADAAKAAKPEVKTWSMPLDLDLRLPLFLDPDRDNAGRRYGDLETELHFQSRIESGPLRSFAGRVELFSEVEQPGIRLHKLNFADVTLSSRPTDPLTLWAFYRRLRNLQGGIVTNSPIGGGLSYQVGEKWHFIASQAYDLELHETSSHNFTLRRLGHDWMFEVTVAFNDITDEHVFSVNFQPIQLLRRGRQIGAVSNLFSSSIYGQDLYTQ